MEVTLEVCRGYHKFIDEIIRVIEGTYPTFITDSIQADLTQDPSRLSLYLRMLDSIRDRAGLMNP